jgi:hypothetical protein
MIGLYYYITSTLVFSIFNPMVVELHHLFQSSLTNGSFFYFGKYYWFMKVE